MFIKAMAKNFMYKVPAYFRVCFVIIIVREESQNCVEISTKSLSKRENSAAIFRVFLRVNLKSLLQIFALLLQIFALLLQIFALLLQIFALLLQIFALLLQIFALLLKIFALLLQTFALSYRFLHCSG